MFGQSYMRYEQPADRKTNWIYCRSMYCSAISPECADRGIEQPIRATSGYLSDGSGRGACGSVSHLIYSVLCILRDFSLIASAVNVKPVLHLVSGVESGICIISLLGRFDAPRIVAHGEYRLNPIQHDLSRPAPRAEHIDIPPLAIHLIETRKQNILREHAK